MNADSIFTVNKQIAHHETQNVLMYIFNISDVCVFGLRSMIISNILFSCDTPLRMLHPRVPLVEYGR